MGFQLSPGVVVKEIDLTGIVPAVGSTEGGFAGNFNWGPVNQIVTVGNESELVDRFGKPDANTYVDFFVAANFLSYGNNLKVVRAANTSLVKNASSDGVGYPIYNDYPYEDNYSWGGSTSGATWCARYVGELGNTLKVSTCPSSSAYQGTMTAKANTVSGSNTVIFSANVHTDSARPLVIGDLLTIGSAFDEAEVVSIAANGLTVTVSTTASATGNTTTSVGSWKHYPQFDSAPGTSTYTSNRGGSNDEMHIVVIDEDGLFSGIAGTIIEKFGFVSKAADAKNDDGSANYYRDVIWQRSKYVYWTDHPSGATNWGSDASGTTFTSILKPEYVSLSGGVGEGYGVGNDAMINAYDLFKNADEVDVSLIMLGSAYSSVVIHVINNIVEYRKDCMAFLSPGFSQQRSIVVSSAITTRNQLPSSSYAVMDSGWKYQFDKYNNVYRWVPLNGDTAGLCVRTDRERDPWYSPAGFNRGQINNVTKLNYSPTKTERDELYKNGINPVVTFPGEGTILYGDKTLLAKPSAFDRINVRRLFIVLEKAIAKASKYSLFEFNDAFTRAQFVNMVEPYLRDVKGRRGIYDFRVVCDTTNNTPTVIDRNEFVGDIYIKPARSINFITLNFVATPTGVSFEEIVGRF